MRFLLDTHTFLWFILDRAELSHRALGIIEDGDVQLLLSVASLWETAIKVSLGKLALGQPFSVLFPRQLEINDITLLPIRLEHVAAVATLPLHHRDPFDRMIITQGMVDGLPVLSADPAFDAYGVERLW